MQMTKASGQLSLMPDADRLHHLEVDSDEVVAAHAGLARNAGRDDHDIGSGQAGKIIGPDHPRIEPLDRRRFGEVERLALRYAFDDVEQDDVAEFLQPGQKSQRAADLAGADQCDFLACHAAIVP